MLGVCRRSRSGTRIDASVFVGSADLPTSSCTPLPRGGSLLPSGSVRAAAPDALRTVRPREALPDDIVTDTMVPTLRSRPRLGPPSARGHVQLGRRQQSVLYLPASVSFPHRRHRPVVELLPNDGDLATFDSTSGATRVSPAVSVRDDVRPHPDTCQALLAPCSTCRRRSQNRPRDRTRQLRPPLCHYGRFLPPWHYFPAVGLPRRDCWYRQR